MLNCGEWEATDAGICRLEFNAKGEIYRVNVCLHSILPIEKLINIGANNEKLHLTYFKDNKLRDDSRLHNLLQQTKYHHFG